MAELDERVRNMRARNPAANGLRLECVGAASEPAHNPHSSLAGSFDDWHALRAAVDGGHMTFSNWFGGVASQGWRSTPIRTSVAMSAPQTAPRPAL